MLCDTTNTYNIQIRKKEKKMRKTCITQLIHCCKNCIDFLMSTNRITTFKITNTVFYTV